jgi:hypothetical protein
VKHAAASNSLLQGISQRIYRLCGLKIADSARKAQKFLLAQGTEQGFQRISRQSVKQIRVTGRFMTARVSLAAK